MKNLGYTLSMTQLWVVMILFGAILCETVMIYPNIFHDVPRSLDIAMDFMTITGPHDFFPPIGMLSLILGILALIFNWRTTTARYWILASVFVILSSEFILSVVYFWPRNTIMFEEGTAVHSIAYLQQVATQFQTAHWIRVAG